jgi:2'-5' RNA ligase
MRLFVAVEINDEIRNEAVKLMGSLRDSGADLKTVSPENLHITLKFLGDVREDYVKRISDTLEEFSSGFQPFRMGFSVMGYFGGARFPRVIWVGISEGRDTISSMAKGLNNKLSWVREEDKKPRPHLTLARVRTPMNSEKLVETIQSLRDVKLGELDVKEIRLKSSLLKPGGPVYSDLGTFQLGRQGS